MGCGCGRNKSNKIKRLKLLKGKSIHNLKLELIKKAPIKAPITESQKRTLICKSCPLGVQTIREKKAGILVCHKTNRLVNNLILDPKFNCPMGKWN